MSVSPYENSPKKTLLDCIGGKFEEACKLFAENENTIGIGIRLGEQVEIIALNPTAESTYGGNVRYLIARGALLSEKISIESAGQEIDEFDVEYAIVMLYLGSEDPRSVSEIKPEDAWYLNTLLVSDQGVVSSDMGQLNPEASQELISSLMSSEVARALPTWLNTPPEDDKELSQKAKANSFSEIDQYLDLATEAIALDGYKIIGKLTIGGCEYIDGKLYLEIFFTDERSGLLRKYIPAPQNGSQEGLTDE
jgi:hypothetical protein